MIGPNCQLEQGEGAAECAGCGVVFAKLRSGRPARPARAGVGPATASQGAGNRWIARLFGEEGGVDPLALAGRLLLLLDLAPYVADARALQLVLIGGRTGAEVEGHDWEAILGTLGLLRYDVTLRRAFHFVGTVVMAAALLWAGGLLWRQARRWADRPRPAG